MNGHTTEASEQEQVVESKTFPGAFHDLEEGIKRVAALSESLAERLESLCHPVAPEPTADPEAGPPPSWAPFVARVHEARYELDLVVTRLMELHQRLVL